MVEYDKKMPKALIEYKARGARVKLHDANNSALRNLADMAGLPAFLVVYDKLRLLFGVVPLNDLAHEWCPGRMVYNEPQYVNFLLTVRGRKISSR